MAKKARQRVSYVLPLANSPGGHRLGVNGLAIDSQQEILYSGGRDGAICAWDLNLNLNNSSTLPDDLDDPFADPDDPPADSSSKKLPLKTTFRAQTQAHTHWVNDIALVQNNTALVSASSDLTVRVWRPQSDDDTEAPAVIGQHADYVKCLAAPNVNVDWIASGGLDRRVCVWDLNGAGKKLEIDVGHEELNAKEKGSIYALSVSRSMMASGGPERIVRLWDPRSGKSITKFLGHTDVVRDILISDAGNTIMSASSDSTVKIWSVTAGRCMHTLTMHNDSVWNLYSEHPDLEVFYSSDKSGLLVKTDVRGTNGEYDDGLSVAVAQEHGAINKVLAWGDHIWTSTSSSSINRWPNIDTGAEAKLPTRLKHYRTSSIASESLSMSEGNERTKKDIPAKSILRISNTAAYVDALVRDDAHEPLLSNGHKPEVTIASEGHGVEPIHHLPEETIEGQHGLVKHKLLNSRRHALTLDTAGDVLMWDLLQCVPIRSFGKCHLEDVEPMVNTMEAVAPWCSIDTRTGRLAVILEEYNAFDGEMYADELVLEDKIEFREDQRINLGKWVLRHIFSSLIDEFIKRDAVYRADLQNAAKEAATEKQAKMTISIPNFGATSWQDLQGGAQTTPRANGNNYPMTPGYAIGVATPGALPATAEDGTPLDRKGTRQSVEGYFSSSLTSPTSRAEADTSTSGPPQTPAGDDKELKSPVDGEKSMFGKKFKMGMSFKKGLSKAAASTMPPPKAEKPAAIAEATKEEGSETSEPPEPEVDNCFRGALQKIRRQYDLLLAENPSAVLDCGITPSLPNETPVLKPPPLTTVIIQEETSGGSADLYRGTVGQVGKDATLIEQRAPMWLGDVLLRNQIPLKEPVKVSFMLQPWQDLLPSVAGPDGNTRLNANRMLRVKKILSYVAERIEANPPFSTDPNAMRPEEYLDMYCLDQKLPIGMTLATLRAHVWKGGPDVQLFYKSNGKREIPFQKKNEEVVEERVGEATSGANEQGAANAQGT